MRLILDAHEPLTSGNHSSWSCRLSCHGHQGQWKIHCALILKGIQRWWDPQIYFRIIPSPTLTLFTWILKNIFRMFFCHLVFTLKISCQILASWVFVSRSKRIPNSSGLEVEFEVRSQLRAGLLRRFTDLLDMLEAVLCHISIVFFFKIQYERP